MIPRALTVLVTILCSACFVRGGAGLLFLAADTAIITAIVVSHMPPPAPLVVEVPAYRPGYAWQPGYWILQEGAWKWVDGAWVQLQPGYAWVPAQWRQRPDGDWELLPGHWVEGAQMPPPPPSSAPASASASLTGHDSWNGPRLCIV
jgi:hypothetical protein